MQLSFYFPDPPLRDRRGRCGAIRLLFTKKLAPGSGDTQGDSLLQKLLGFTLKFLTYYEFHLSPAQHGGALTGVKRELSSPVRKRISPRWAGASFAFTRGELQSGLCSLRQVTEVKLGRVRSNSGWVTSEA